MNLQKYKGIVLLKQDFSIEAKKINLYCTVNNIPILRINKNEFYPENYFPSGSVEWCSSLLNTKIIPEYYPKWLEDYFHRKIWYTDSWPLNKTCFIKPANKYKKFTGFVHRAGSYKNKKRNCTYWCSEIVEFNNEWRYYVADGKVLCSKWYWGDEINTPKAPKLNINIPSKYCGALDFGTLKNGKLALIEAQHPFSCGWYGANLDDIELYIEWLAKGWDYMKKLSIL